MELSNFRSLDFLGAIKALLKELNVPFNAIADEPVPIREILSDKTYKDNATFRLINEVFFVGMVDDAAFEGNESLAPDKIKSDYDGILFFGVALDQRDNKRLPTRGQLADIARAFNREFYYTPVVVIFKYQDERKEYIAFANTERLPYKQEWREGEKAGKVSLLRDIAINSPHRGHEDIINQLRIPTSGSKAVSDFDSLYKYWQEVFSVSILNKKFYQELSNWYFWAIKNVTFPNLPTLEIAHQKGVKLEDLIQEHNATNVIRLLTRLLFTWFIKEKKLIPEELFDLDTLQKDILKEISPYHQEGMFKQANEESVYYKAILQNLFFASLNCPIEPDDVDERRRGFRGLESYGKHRGIDYLMRYEKYFKDPQAFLDLMNSTVPFLNGGLFECLDEKIDKNLYVDGFSDQMTKGEQLIIPDYLFFGLDEEVDLSKDYGLKSKKHKKAAVKGLINILKSYKFTVTENTPIEEDVALDPELLGKVFENLLASYNPETKTTARKQTGSFYTPREIVNYMVDESLIAYLKNAVQNWEMEEEALDKALHQLASFDSINPFTNYPETTNAIITALDRCKILDPACGSGAFPMGVLQKMVNILQKLDPENELWKKLQLSKALQATEVAYGIEDKAERKEKLLEINDAFDESVNDPDYARKLYLIENCIYGVDIQPIAIQISKLRFFISLIVDQKVNNDKPNFGIRALPNLETKFVTANTLIGIEKPLTQTSLFNTDRIKELEGQLKNVRKKLFSARTKKTKTKYRLEDERLRNAIAEELKSSGWPNETAEKLAAWDPYDQNTSSTFFDPEWMFDISDGFDVVIGNPPYINAIELKKRLGKLQYKDLKAGFESAKGTIDIYILFFEFGLKNLSDIGHLIYISPNRYLSASYGKALRELIYKDYSIKSISDFSNVRVFEAASIYPIVSLLGKLKSTENISVKKFNSKYEILGEWYNDFSDLDLLPGKIWGFLLNSKIDVVKKIISVSQPLSSSGVINATSTAREADNYHELINEEKGAKLLNTGTIDKFISLWGTTSLTDKGTIYRTPFIDIDNQIISKQRKKLYESPKIILAKIGLSAEAFFDESGEYASINTNCIHSFKANYDPKYITLWLNSSLYHFLFSCFFDGLRMAGGYLLYSAPNLKSTYIKQPNEVETKIAIALHDLTKWCLSRDIAISFDQINDAFLFNVYFSGHMKEREIDVLEFVKRDVEKVLKGRGFEKLSEKEQEEVIKQLHSTWIHPDNEVRNRMKLFAVRSPEILKPILEG